MGDTNGNVQVQVEPLETSDQQSTDSALNAYRSFRKNSIIAKNVVAGSLDVSLLTANANQLRLLLAYNGNSPTYFVCMGLVIASLVLEVLKYLGVIIIKSYPNSEPWLGVTIPFSVAIITVINLLLAALIQL